jgi:hypothetical protein
MLTFTTSIVSAPALAEPTPTSNPLKPFTTKPVLLISFTVAIPTSAPTSILISASMFILIFTPTFIPSSVLTPALTSIPTFTSTLITLINSVAIYSSAPTLTTPKIAALSLVTCILTKPQV